MGPLSILGIKSREQLVREAMAEGAVGIDGRTPQGYNEGYIKNFTEYSGASN